MLPRNRLARVMKQYSPTGRRNHGRPLKRLLGTWDRNGSTSGPTPYMIFDLCLGLPSGRFHSGLPHQNLIWSTGRNKYNFYEWPSAVSFNSASLFRSRTRIFSSILCWLWTLTFPISYYCVPIQWHVFEIWSGYVISISVKSGVCALV